MNNEDLTADSSEENVINQIFQDPLLEAEKLFADCVIMAAKENEEKFDKNKLYNLCKVHHKYLLLKLQHQDMLVQNFEAIVQASTGKNM